MTPYRPERTVLDEAWKRGWIELHRVCYDIEMVGTSDRFRRCVAGVDQGTRGS